MSDEGDKTCPLCAEEMDMTDQQLKPCKCGYEICVWCWHHIMEMAEKDETEGRCPACRTPYDKEKIVGTAANCGRFVAEISVEKKKSQKAKMKTSEGRKQLSSVRVIQRNLVYIVGLPLNLADEDLLLRKEYFGQYGKVLKVSMSRTSAGTIQQFPNSTCSVYITYSKEEEAVRCIQAIHGFTLEGRTLRACFGTTKYCHAWLRNVPCTNPDCLYLHEVGSQEDSFTKDEIISAYSRVQQITGIANSMQRRSGSVLPPPADELCNNSSATTGKPAVKNTSNSLVTSARVSPPSSSAGRTGALPAAASWGARASTCQSSAGGLASSNGPEKQKPDAAGAPLAFSAAVAGLTQTSVQTNDLGKKIITNDDSHSKESKSKSKPPENFRQHAAGIQINLSEDSHEPLVAHAAPMATGKQPSPPATLDSNKTRLSVQEQSNAVGMEKEGTFTSDKKDQKSSSDASSISIDKSLASQISEVKRPNGLSLDCFLVPRDQGLQQYSDTKLQVNMEPPVSKATTSMGAADAFKLNVKSSAAVNIQSEKEEDFDIQRLSDAIVTQASFSGSSHQYDLLNHLRSPSHQYSDAAGAINHHVNPAVNRQGHEHLASIASNTLIASNGLADNQLQFRSGVDNSCVLPDGLHGHRIGVPDSGAGNVDLNLGIDGIESSIISNILSLDLDTWDESMTSPQDLVKLLGENERQQGSFNLSSSWKGQNSNQSRFSFARQEEPRSHAFNVETSFNSRASPHLLNHALLEHREPYLDRLGNGFVTAQRGAEQYDGFGGGQSVFSTNRHSVSRSQISAPPGFSAPSRLPPPGFTSHGRNDPTFDVRSGNHFFENSSLRSPYQASPSTNISNVADIEFIDPAILAVGKGRPPSGLSNSNIDTSPFLSQTSAFENDSRFQLLMQKSSQPHQNHRYADTGDNYTPNDASVFSSRRMEPLQNGSLSFSQFANQSRGGMSSNHWDSWPEVMAGNNIGMSEHLRNDRPGFNQLYSGYEESKYRMSGSGDMYNRTYGI